VNRVNLRQNRGCRVFVNQARSPRYPLPNRLTLS
jgi:hypothetical protein